MKTKSFFTIKLFLDKISKEIYIHLVYCPFIFLLEEYNYITQYRQIIIYILITYNVLCIFNNLLIIDNWYFTNLIFFRTMYTVKIVFFFFNNDRPKISLNKSFVPHWYIKSGKKISGKEWNTAWCTIVQIVIFLANLLNTYRVQDKFYRYARK